MFVAVDQEGGRVQVLRGPGFADIPSAVAQGTWPTAKLQAESATWGRQLRQAGVNVNLAPVGDTLSPDLGNQNAPLGRFDRALGTMPNDVARHVAAIIRGMRSAGIATTVKHFPGLGRVRENTDFSADVIDTQTTSTDENLAPFAEATKAGSDWLMVSSAYYKRIDPNHPGLFSKTLHQLIRQKLKFTGLVVSDDTGNAKQLRATPAGDRAVLFLEAGGDLVLTGAPEDLPEIIESIQTATEKRPGFAERLADAERRVLEAKLKAGLLPC
jgi:beta-N-acetylhexosaminidase